MTLVLHVDDYWLVANISLMLLNRKVFFCADHDGYRHHNLQSSRLPRSHDTNGRLSRHHGDDTSEGVTLRPPVPPTVFDYMPDTVKKGRNS